MSSKPLPKQVAVQAELAKRYDDSFKEPAEPVAAAQPAPEPAPPVAPAPPAPSEHERELVELRHKYQTLQGMHRTQQVKQGELEAKLNEALGTIAELRTKLEKPAAQPTAQPTAVPGVTKADEEAFGADMIDLARRIAAEEFGRREAQYQERITNLETALQGTNKTVEDVSTSVQQTADERFFGGLDSRIPGWEAIQKTPECQQWLGGRVPGTKQLWNDVLVTAASERDLESALEVFDTLFSVHPKLRPQQPGSAPRAPTPTQPTPPPANPLEAEVAPARTPGDNAPGNGPPSKRVLKAKEYEAESMRVIRLRQAGREDEAVALEAELDTILKEGRITP